MKGSDVLRVVDQMQHEKNIDREIIFSGIEAALQLAAEKKFGEGSGVTVSIDRDTGTIFAQNGDQRIDPSELGRISAQLAKQVMIQKIREAECKSVFDDYAAMKGDLVNGQLVRHEGGAAIVSLGKTEALLPRSEQIPGESHHAGERVKAVILDVRKQGHRVKIILSRTHPDFVRRLFEGEIPEIAERTIEIRAVAREAGYRCKIAVSSIDLKVDCVGACVGVRGSRIKNIVDELGGERIDIVRWNDSLQVLIPNALQPAQIDEVFLYPHMGRAIVLVKDDQLSLAIGRRGQNVRLASKLVGWDIEIMTLDELNEGIEKAEAWFSQVPGITAEMVEAFIEAGFLSLDDLTVQDPVVLAEMLGVTEEEADDMIIFAEETTERLERQSPEANEAEALAGRAMATQLLGLATESVEVSSEGESTEQPSADEAFSENGELEQQAEAEVQVEEGEASEGLDEPSAETESAENAQEPATEEKPAQETH